MEGIGEIHALYASGALEDDHAVALFIVLDGWVKLYRVAPSGAEAVVSVMTRGRSFGEAVALKGGIYPVSAEAITPVRLLRLDGVRLRHLLESDATLATSMLAATYVHLQQLVEQVEAVAVRQLQVQQHHLRPTGHHMRPCIRKRHRRRDLVASPAQHLRIKQGQRWRVLDQQNARHQCPARCADA